MPLTVWVNSKIQIQISLVGSVKRIFSTRVRISRSRSSKVIDLGTNRKRVCDFPLVHHSNFGPILHRFRDIADFFATNPYSTQILGVFPLDQIVDVGFSPSIYRELICREIIFEVFQPMCWTSQTDGLTDGQTTYCGMTALCRCSFWPVLGLYKFLWNSDEPTTGNSFYGAASEASLGAVYIWWCMANGLSRR